MNEFNEPNTLAPTGLYLGGTKYMVIQGEPGAVIRGKKVLSLSPPLPKLSLSHTHTHMRVHACMLRHFGLIQSAMGCLLRCYGFVAF